MWRTGLVAAVLAGAGPAWAQRSYVGADACAGCHAFQAQWLAGSVHDKQEVRTPEGETISGCEVCHGPGSEHIKKFVAGTIRGFQAEPAKERMEVCLACHTRTHPELNYRRSAHMRRGVACNDCHAATGSEGFHRMRAVEDVMEGVQPDLCYRCHVAQRADFSLPYRHPVGEGFMGCTSCHNPHGEFTTTRQMRARQSEAVCGKCHEDNQGPFIFEHPPGRASGCQACHQPHGSTNAKLLKRAQARFLCLECHADTPSFHDLRQAEFQNCTICHSRVHGSNLSRQLFE